ncbi:RNA polymerase factor sigma-54 [uncultured Thiothrix sp.]|uniref:RNA polymerase factor sigma-54 n=1 Tax=uncultured Thiothrix sp. TaxID=223185 RepID=UPI00260529ED|nr:RNA polymerase factor sigma-54 [uncultured Thiothrix sp.]HMT93561.1 RNA polymerase factor sigma-54 [Thiolinea sp.]
MLRQGLDIRIGQTLSMTPQLQQAIRLLQLSSIELQEEIQQALEENPLLQLAEDSGLTNDEPLTERSPNAEHSTDSTESLGDNDLSELGEVDTPSNMDSDIPEDLNLDATWDDVYDTSIGSNHDGDSDNQAFLENQGSSSEDLQEHLLWQITLSQLSEIDKRIAVTIVQSLDEAGYLCESVEDILESLIDELPIELDDVEMVLKYIQHLDPLGVGARDLRECMLIQLYKQPTNELQKLAVILVEKHLDLLEKRDYKEIQKRLKINQDTFEAMITLLRTLQPKPGNAFSANTTDYITPDVFVHKIRNAWVVSLNQRVTPELQINQMYADMIGQVKNSTDSHYLKNNLQQARWLIRSLESRNSTILNVAKAIVERQSAFMQYGEQAMKPLILRDIAEELEMHESTISRVTTNKYMYTPRGIFEFKYFFSSQLDTDTGSSCSSTAIRAMLKQLIAKEDARSPLSDSSLTQLLKDQGINVARRTVTKYREAMSIPSSHERKGLVTT